MALRYLPTCLLGFVAIGCGSGTPPAKKAEPVARAEVAASTLDVGETDGLHSLDKVFSIRNTGDKPLRLKLARKSRGVTTVESPAEVAPGAEAAVTVHWTPPPTASGPFSAAAEFETNDPKARTLRLEIKGTVNPRVRIVPPTDAIELDAATPTRTLTVFSTMLDAFGLRVPAEYPGLAAEVAPLPAGEMIEGTRAKSGYRVTVRTTDQLTRGYSRHDLALHVKVPGDEVRKLILPVHATTPGGILKVTPAQIEFRKRYITEADRVTVAVDFQGHSDGEGLQVASFEPAFLVISTPVRIVPGKWQFTVEMPNNDPAARRHQAEGLLEGRIVLRASQVWPTMAARVRWQPPAR